MTGKNENLKYVIIDNKNIDFDDIYEIEVDV